MASNSDDSYGSRFPDRETEQCGEVPEKLSRLDPAEKSSLGQIYPFLRLCELLYLKKVTAFISPLQYYAGVLASHGVDDERINVVPNGIDTSIFAPNPGQARESKRPSVLFTGRLVSHKGIDTILRAIPLVLKENSEVQFTFTGAGIPEIYLRQVEDRRVLDCVKFLGFIEDYFAMAQVYSRSDVFVLPSLFENCPMSVLEAMSSEVPVITTTVGGIPDIITSGENGILIAPHDHVTLANNIISLLYNKASGSIGETRPTNRTRKILCGKNGKQNNGRI